MKRKELVVNTSGLDSVCYRNRDFLRSLSPHFSVYIVTRRNILDACVLQVIQCSCVAGVVYVHYSLVRPMSHLRFCRARLSDAATVKQTRFPDHFSRFTILLHRHSSKMAKLFYIYSFLNSSIDRTLSFCETAYTKTKLLVPVPVL